jgi:hypothetical protein
VKHFENWRTEKLFILVLYCSTLVVDQGSELSLIPHINDSISKRMTVLNGLMENRHRHFERTDEIALPLIITLT